MFILTRCQSLTISDIRPLALKFHMAHGMACRSRALQLERNMAFQYLLPSLSKDCWKEGYSEQQSIVLASLIFLYIIFSRSSGL